MSHDTPVPINGSPVKSSSFRNKKDKGPPVPKISSQLTITMYDDGHAEVNGPIQNKLLCYGLLGIGQEIVQGATAQRAMEHAAAVAVAESRKGSRSWWRKVFRPKPAPIILSPDPAEDITKT